MQIVMNRVSPKGLENQVVYLSDLSKDRIIRELVKLTQSPSIYTLAQAENIPEIDPVEPKDKVTLSEWLEEQGLNLPKPQKHRLARLVSEHYEAAIGTLPKPVTRPNTKGKWNTRSNAFKPSELHILKEALEDARSRGWVK